ncbi:hypothetical protein B0H15DRAFT_34048 [Mycena belliarum]|uniref:Uncharacterized protein n=1 Tax=Mycena belliarum TaxID=1033014 RepID=A0AAD6XW68_9AGAR|nr:hypothetical protein B0H15DRAFT_34048 [Mycena belliae]
MYPSASHANAEHPHAYDEPTTPKTPTGPEKENLNHHSKSSMKSFTEKRSRGALPWPPIQCNSKSSEPQVSSRSEGSAARSARGQADLNDLNERAAANVISILHESPAQKSPATQSGSNAPVNVKQGPTSQRSYIFPSPPSSPEFRPLVSLESKLLESRRRNTNKGPSKMRHDLSSQISRHRFTRERTEHHWCTSPAPHRAGPLERLRPLRRRTANPAYPDDGGAPPPPGPPSRRHRPPPPRGPQAARALSGWPGAGFCHVPRVGGDRGDVQSALCREYLRILVARPRSRREVCPLHLDVSMCRSLSSGRLRLTRSSNRYVVLVHIFGASSS